VVVAEMAESFLAPEEEAEGVRWLWVLVEAEAAEGEGEGEGEVEVVLGVVYHFEDGLEERAVSVVTGSGARL
jgi:hypothetical protein